MSLWAFRFVLIYLGILLVQPQNRFLFLYPFRIAMVCMAVATLLHIISASQEGRPIIRFGPATITALVLMLLSYLSLKFGPMQVDKGWNSDIDIIFKNCICLILIEAMANTVERVWAVLVTIMLATLWWVKGGIRLAMAGATYAGDRLMGPAVSLVENPNGFAYFMTLMIPLHLYFYQQTQNKYLRIGYLSLALTSVYIVLQTGSRTGLLALLAVGLFLLPKYGRNHKLAIVVAGVAITIISTSVGALNMERFKTIPDSIRSFLAGNVEELDPRNMNADQHSAWERKMKNKHTWALIKSYPGFGVGVQPSNALVTEKFEYAGGQVHNEILYAGRQMGFPGMMIYLAFMGILLVNSVRIQRYASTHWPALSDLGWTMKMQWLVFVVGGYFSPIPWNPLFLVIAACASACWMNIKNQSWNAASSRF